MRRFFAITKTTALEVLSEPLTLLVLLAALALAVLAPVLHYHQFGEVSRMARDAGLSSVFISGSILSVFGTIRAIRREIEFGTLEMALAHPVSRRQFFLAKTLGAFTAVFIIILVVFGELVTMVIGAEIGGRIAKDTGMLARIWGPAVASGTAVILLPLMLGAIFNRFAHFRFVLSSILFSLGMSLLCAGVLGFLAGWNDLLRLAVAVGLLTVFIGIVLVVSAAFAIRFSANMASTLSGLMLVAMLPVIGNYYRAEDLANGGVLSAAYVGFALLAALPAFVAFLILGVKWTNEKI